MAETAVVLCECVCCRSVEESDSSGHKCGLIDLEERLVTYTAQLTFNF